MMICHSNKRIGVTMPKEMLNVLEALAEALGKTKSEVILISLDVYIRSLDKLLENQKENQ